MCNEVFRARHRDRALCGDEFGELKGLFHHFIATALNNFGYKPQFLSLDRRESSRSVSKLAHERVVPSDLGQERQRADVRCKSNVDFLFHKIQNRKLKIEKKVFQTDLDGEARVRGCIANVANSDEVDSETDNVAMDSGDDREWRTFGCSYSFLESKKGLARLQRCPGAVQSGV